MRALRLTEKVQLFHVLGALRDRLKKRGFRIVWRTDHRGESYDITIGPSSPSPFAQAKCITFNPQAAVRLSQSPRLFAMTLFQHGIPVDPELLPKRAVRPANLPARDTFQLVEIHIADLHVLSLEKKGSSVLEVFPAERRQRILEAACRSVYLLGLHFARVDLLVHSQGRWFVRSVEPTPSVDEELGQAYAASLERLAALWLREDKIPIDPVLGADPEFLLARRDGKLLYASRYIKHEGEIGYDRQSRARRGAVFPLAEIRPSPSPSPLVLSANIERTLERAARALPTSGVWWLAGSYPLGKYPTGGHIHISSHPLTTPLLAALDRYVAFSLMLVEQRMPARRRRRRRYGRLGDFRWKEHGGFEYRTPGSWLVSREATKAALCLAYTVVREWPDLVTGREGGLADVKGFYAGKKQLLRRNFQEIWHKLGQTPSAERYAYELAYIPRLVSKRKEWEEQTDIKALWWN